MMINHSLPAFVLNNALWLDIVSAGYMILWKHVKSVRSLPLFITIPMNKNRIEKMYLMKDWHTYA